MAHKPSLLFNLTAAEILRYWALLTPEQRAAFLDERMGDIPDALVQLGGYLRERSPSGASMFDTFAGTYYAFHSLERYVFDALAAGRHKEAEYRLLGRKYDSLHNLLDHVLKETDTDAVNRYVIVLCARQLVQRVERDAPEFRSEHRDAFATLKSRITEAERIRYELTFGTPEERLAFLDWFEEWFLARATAVEAIA